MDVRADKNRLIKTMRIERARWDMLLLQVDSARMAMPGVEGRLSVRDILDDLVQQERWVADQLEQVAPGEIADKPTLAQEPANRSLSLSVVELIAESRRAFEQIMSVLMRPPGHPAALPYHS